MYIIKPSIRWEFPVVHLVNFLIYLSSMVCFDFFWRQVMNSRQAISADFSEDDVVALPERAMLTLGYLLFIWSSLNLISIWTVTPDMCLAAFLYLTAGLILIIRNGSATWSTYALLGLILSLGYLTKAAVFPLAFVFLIIALFSSPNIRQVKSPFLASGLIFFLIAGSFVAILSNAKGRLTFSDAGKITYIRYVNNLPYPHWQGETPDNGLPLHPTRKVFDNPPIYEFSRPIGGTYPVSYDPSYWYEGAVAQFKLKQQAKLIISSVLFYLDFFFNQQGVMVAAIFILFIMSRWRRWSYAR
jgi:4-amino-4-deoxy-L-arabinose transferase-like glycosyltransferase